MILSTNQAIKILRVNPEDGSLESCHGGYLKWSPPVENQDGSILPGEWSPPVEPIICHQGYHLTDPKGLVWWFSKSGLRAYLVEYRGKVHGSFEDFHDRKIAVESCRILRSLTDEEHAEHGVFFGGEHTIKEGVCRAYGNAYVYAHDNSGVFAYGDAGVTAYDNVRVRAYDNVRVRAYDNVRVTAFDHSKVDAGDNVWVSA